jgi:uncharacterized protein (DUF2126 family)/transglutaminase-like putative cysteine protease
MGILAGLHHVTKYEYERPIALGPQTIRLRPAPHSRADIQSFALKIEPKNHFINWQQDPFGNYLARIVFPEKVKSFKVEVDLVTNIKVFNPFDFFLEASAENIPLQYDSHLQEELAPYLEIKDNSPQLLEYVATIPDTPTPTINYLVKVNSDLYNHLSYTIRLEPGVQTCLETLTLKSGSCRDMAWLLCQILRHKGLATRFASGYLIQLKADVKSLDGPSGTETDFTDLHAWCEVYLPGAGWVGLDPTSGLFTGEGHIPLCCTPSPISAAPISGSLEMCETQFSHEMKVERIHEDRRVTLPFSDSEWAQIDALGQKVEKSLQKQDVRLTMGGEPTFVSLDDRIGSEWHFTALSEKKKELGFDVFQALAKRFANGAFVHHAQGKWYPGEILPRWAMNAFWRIDKQDIICNPKTLANPNKKYNYKTKDARNFMQNLAKVLGFDQRHIIAAYEDSAYYLWKEQRIPIEGDIKAADLLEDSERKRLQKLIDADLGAPVGYVLPIMFSAKTNNWLSNLWQFKSENLRLLAGDSPIGLRLPLASLPNVDFAKFAEHEFPVRSPFAPIDELEKSQILLEKFTQKLENAIDAKICEGENGLVRSALCVEVRDGSLFIFLPPLNYAEHYFELISACEAIAQKQNLQIIFEGYAPPKDCRIQSLSVTPDPGVIEINIQPANNWNEMKAIIEGVYEDAYQNRLIADKFMIDGRRIGTGGGNHIVMGAQKAEDSPFLRRPDLLRSMITFWQHHPSLSYLFSGLYIGPTSQAPRIDEARHESLYELELAFAQMPQSAKDGDCPPWLVDRLLRNLLVDLTGNTHRAEFCIDKLYSPDSDRGRLGLLEMRGFEMSPHPKMNLMQNLLLRALIAAFWKKPYVANFARWGTQLHDKFMLPHFVREDLIEVLDYLRNFGFEFNLDWFVPFFDFRFPQYGSVQVGDINLELRMALEPWPVMGEEPNGAGVSRGVDSSLERLQIRLLGAVPQHYAITCNGRRVPLCQTREALVQVGGVRFKAWNPYSSLHPNLPINSPLTFDIIDTRLERSIGGCIYHVMHPGGRAYDELPLNENEAQGRRISRFVSPTHSTGKIKTPYAEINPDYPHTLDLRKK